MKYQIVNQAEGDSVDIHINDFIGDWIDYYWGFGVTSRQFIEDLQKLPDNVKTVRLHISTPGGDVIAANHIANAIADQQAKGRVFESLITAAFSAGTIITSATKVTKIADNGLMMIHDPWTVVAGNARELRKAADASDKFRDSIVAVYKRKSKLSEKRLAELMSEETYMDAGDAIKNGFADEKIDSVVVNAAFDISLAGRLPNVPEQYRARVQSLFGIEAPKPAPTITPEQARAEVNQQLKDIEAHCAAAGVPGMALEYFNLGLTAEQVKTRLADAKAIRDACTAAFSGDATAAKTRADAYVKAGMTLTEVRAELAMMKFREDVPIEGHLPADVTKPAPKTMFDPQKIMARYANNGRHQPAK